MNASLLPERAVSFSPSMAVTLGLEEAILLQGLQEIALHSSAASPGQPGQWVSAESEQLQKLFPFWQADEVWRIASSLQAKGVVVLKHSSHSQAQHLYFALNDSSESAGGVAEAALPAANSRTSIALDWRPDAAVMTQIQQQGISAEFAEAQLEEFVHYWRQRGERNFAWGNTFLRHVIAAWRRQQASGSAGSPMLQHWQPSEDALEILDDLGISRGFAEDAIPEFVLYWRERGEATNTWNSKFLAHVKRQWARYHSALTNDSEPHVIPATWQPSGDAYDILRIANIDPHFAKALVPEFVLFWKDTKQAHSSWNTKFLQHVKYHWARKHDYQRGGVGNGGQQRSDRTSRGADKNAQSVFERLTDRSWLHD